MVERQTGKLRALAGLRSPARGCQPRGLPRLPLLLLLLLGGWLPLLGADIQSLVSRDAAPGRPDKAAARSTAGGHTLDQDCLQHLRVCCRRLDA